MKSQRRTPPLWRAWVESLLEKPTTIRMLRERQLTVDDVRQIASAEAGLARFGTVHVQTPVLADLLQQPVERVMRARLALVHLHAVVFTRMADGSLARELALPASARPGRKPPSAAVAAAFERMDAEGCQGEVSCRRARSR